MTLKDSKAIVNYNLQFCKASRGIITLHHHHNCQGKTTLLVRRVLFEVVHAMFEVVCQQEQQH